MVDLPGHPALKDLGVHVLEVHEEQGRARLASHRHLQLGQHKHGVDGGFSHGRDVIVGVVVDVGGGFEWSGGGGGGDGYGGGVVLERGGGGGRRGGCVDPYFWSRATAGPLASFRRPPVKKKKRIRKRRKC